MLELRLQLVEARATLRAAKDSYELRRAEAEQHAIDSGCNGKNAEERARNLTRALASDVGYQRALAWLRASEAEVERLDALLEAARDARRAEEWQIRARLADALLRAGVQSDSAEPAGDVAFDDAADHMSCGDLDSEYYAGQRRPQPHYSMLADEDVEVSAVARRIINTIEWYGR